nr:lipoate--protein ligase family protein [candidate division Zixibacteria bacterium]
MPDGCYYITPLENPYFNMMFDEWLFDRLKTDSRSPRAVLRLYSWDTAAVTIGYNQNLEKAVDFTLLDNRIPVIRRITGGRAIYHDPSELTYTVLLDLGIFPPPMRTLSRTARQISEAISDMLAVIGLKAIFAKSSERAFMETTRARKKSCFDSVSRYEIISDGSKIAGGAQRRIGLALIQQGSIKLNGISRCDAIGQAVDGDEVSESNGGKIYTIGQIEGLFGQSFSEKFGINFRIEVISKEIRGKIARGTAGFKEKCLKKR